MEFTITAKECRKMAQAIHDKLQAEQTDEMIRDIQSQINGSIKRGYLSTEFYTCSYRYELVDLNDICKKLRKAGFKTKQKNSYGLFSKIDRIIIRW